MRARVPNPIDDGSGEAYACTEIAAGLVVDRINPDRPGTDLRAERVNECLPDPANTSWLAGTTGEHHLCVGARLGRRGWQGWTPEWWDCWSRGKDVLVSGKRRKYTPEFWEQAARLVIETGRPVAQVAAEIGVGEQVLGRWVRLPRRVGAAGDTGAVLDADERRARAPAPWKRRITFGL